MCCVLVFPFVGFFGCILAVTLTFHLPLFLFSSVMFWAFLGCKHIGPPYVPPHPDPPPFFRRVIRFSIDSRVPVFPVFRQRQAFWNAFLFGFVLAHGA